MVQFDYQHQQARALTEQQKTTLSQHLFVPIDR